MSATGTLVISLDFELMWGVRDHRSVADYGDAVLGGRLAIPKILGRFERAGIHATWATVGLLFARNRAEMLEFAPDERPHYADPALSPYGSIEHEIGEDERTDPMHFGRSLLDRIAGTPGQEIATHTYSHFYCQEEGSTKEAFDADIGAAVAIARHNGMRLESIVFPRNQMSREHVDICKRHGITCYRGNPQHFAYQSRSSEENSWPIRTFRLIDSVIPLAGSMTHTAAKSNEMPANVPASRFLRSYPDRLEFLSELHVKRVMAEMKLAARRGETYHLWWHPHNFGRKTSRRLMQLDRLIEQFTMLRDVYDMRSKSMHEAAFL